MSEWQPIETAPKDGRAILAYDSHYGRTPDELPVVIVSWHGKDEEYPWLESIGMQSFGREALTYGMPLPPTPKTPNDGE